MLHSLFDFVDRHRGETGQTFIEMPYMRDLCEIVEDCVLGNLPDGKRNLAIAIAPRHYKTSFVSQAFPAWCFAEWANDCEFILASATAELAISNAVEIRKIIDSPWYTEAYPHVKISKADRDIKHNFRTTASGSIYAAGMEGTIRGFGAGKARPGFAGAVVIDDPIKSDNVRSATIRENCINHYLEVLKSRKNSTKTPFILIMQRLHMDDLVGWVEKNEPEDWHIHSFPSLDELTGKVLNHVTTSRDDLLKLKAVAPSVYYSQYQQQPIIEGGNMIKTEWWRTWDMDAQPKHGGLIYMTADTAFKSGKNNDLSALYVWEGTYDALYCLDGIYGRWEFPELLQRAKDFWGIWERKGCREFWIEDKASGTPLVQMLRDSGVPARGWKPSDFNYPDDKVARVRSASWAIHGGKVFVPAGSYVVRVSADKQLHVAPFAGALIEESSLFAEDMSHAHDDKTDNLTMACSLWQHAGGGVG